MPESQPCDSLIRKITDYLNEYDDGETRWLAATQELVKTIAQDPHNCRLLGMGEDASEDKHQTLAAIGQRGHVILRCPPTHQLGLNPARTFHAGVGTTGQTTEECHLILNPLLIDLPCIAQIIGDVFLEWLHWEDSHPKCIQTLRQ